MLVFTSTFAVGTNSIDDKSIKIEMKNDENLNILNNADKIRINVSKHVVRDALDDMTLEDWENKFLDWLEEANRVWNCSFEFVQVGEIDTVNDTSENRTAGAINIYGTNASSSPPGSAGLCFDQTRIQVGSDVQNNTLAHELGHWFNARPDSTSDDGEHGDPTGSYPGYPGYTGYDTDGDGDCDDNDTGNIMFPGVSRDADASSDPQQQQRARENATEWLENQNAVVLGNAHNAADELNDADNVFFDITDTSSWLKEVDGEYILELTILTQQLLFFELPYQLGFYLETDDNISTGSPTEDGTDYYIAFDPFVQSVYFWVNMNGEWMAMMHPSLIEYEIEYVDFDAPIPHMPIGVTFTISLNGLRHGNAGDNLSYIGVTTNGVNQQSWDSNPNVGSLHELLYPDTIKPKVHISRPQNALYFFDSKIFSFIALYPIVIGKITVEVNASDNETGIDRVEFYVNNIKEKTDKTYPYKWEWTGISFGFKNVKVVAYDNFENKKSHEIPIIKLL